MSYLRDVKSQLEDVFIASFERAWREVVEPALKQSFANGVEEGRQKDSNPNDDKAAGRRRNRWSSRWKES